MSFILNGEIWTEPLANASLTPVLDGQITVPGHGQKVIDDWLSDAPDQIKAVFYGYLNRIKLSIGTGLSLTYSGASVLANRVVVSIAPGTIQIPANSTQYVFVNAAGQMAIGSQLPDVCLPLGLATSNANSITQLIDIREKVVEYVRPVVLPPAQSPFFPGDLKVTMASVQSGWLLCDGARYNISEYNALYAALGSPQVVAGDPAGTFRVPDFRKRVPIGADAEYLLGRSYGNASTVLDLSQMPRHSHTVVDNGHSHPINDPGHFHGVFDNGHSHTVSDPGHGHITVFPMGGKGDDVGTVFTNNSVNNGYDFNQPMTSQGSLTGISLGVSGSNIRIQNSQTAITAGASSTNISIGMAGSGAAVSLIQPSLAVNVLIKT